MDYEYRNRRQFVKADRCISYNAYIRDSLVRLGWKSISLLSRLTIEPIERIKTRAVVNNTETMSLQNVTSSFLNVYSIDK